MLNKGRLSYKRISDRQSILALTSFKRTSSRLLSLKLSFFCNFSTEIFSFCQIFIIFALAFSKECKDILLVSNRIATSKRIRANQYLRRHAIMAWASP